MNRYKLSFVMYEPSEDTEDKFMAEIPALPGCRAWGDTAAETLYYLQSVAEGFIKSYQERGHELPAAVMATRVEVGEVDEVMVIA